MEILLYHVCFNFFFNRYVVSHCWAKAPLSSSIRLWLQQIWLFQNWCHVIFNIFFVTNNVNKDLARFLLQIYSQNIPCLLKTLSRYTNNIAFSLFVVWGASIVDQSSKPVIPLPIFGYLQLPTTHEIRLLGHAKVFLCTRKWTLGVCAGLKYVSLKLNRTNTVF